MDTGTLNDWRESRWTDGGPTDTVCMFVIYDTNFTKLTSVTQMADLRGNVEICDKINAFSAAKNIDGLLMISTYSYGSSLQYKDQFKKQTTTTFFKLSERAGKIKLTQNDQCIKQRNKVNKPRS